jgi:hypothetical protein
MVEMIRSIKAKYLLWVGLVFVAFQGCASTTDRSTEAKRWCLNIRAKFNLLGADGESEPYYERRESITFTEGTPVSLFFGNGAILVAAGVRYVEVEGREHPDCEAVAEVTLIGQEIVADASRNECHLLDLNRKKTYFMPTCLVLKSDSRGTVMRNPILHGGIILSFHDPSE